MDVGGGGSVDLEGDLAESVPAADLEFVLERERGVLGLGGSSHGGGGEAACLLLVGVGEDSGVAWVGFRHGVVLPSAQRQDQLSELLSRLGDGCRAGVLHFTLVHTIKIITTNHSNSTVTLPSAHSVSTLLPSTSP